MPYLIIVSLIWAFSFGLIKYHLGGLDSASVAALRMFLALLVFIPFFKYKKISANALLNMIFIGAIQFGAMYIFYLKSFAYLDAHEVAFFTIFTPIYIILLDSALQKHTNRRHLWAALLSIVAADIALANHLTRAIASLFLPQVVPPPAFVNNHFLMGFLLVQASNLCFAAGQVAYKRIRPLIKGTSDAALFSYLLSGAFLSTLIFSFFVGGWASFNPEPLQWGVLVYLGTIASGLGFFLWNKGLLRVSTGMLSVFNNAKIPLGILCSLLFFPVQAGSGQIIRLTISILIMLGAIAIAKKAEAKPSIARTPSLKKES